MFKALKRGSASASFSTSFTSLNLRCIRLLQPRKVPRPVFHTPYLFTARSIGTSPQWKQSASASAAQEEEIYTEAPSSDNHTHTPVLHGPITKFKDLATQGRVCQTVVDTITRDMGLETMTEVQSLTLNESLKGTDIVAQARTGTGKTLAFLIPLLQNIINVDPRLEKRAAFGRRNGQSDDIRAIIISPTRELAEQIATEAQKVVRNTGVIVQTAVGGSKKSEGLRRIKQQGCHILVGTPGRLNDILSDPYSDVRAPNLSAFVLDEADRLLDQGFAPDIEEIQRLLPNRTEVDRQTLLYSATLPREVMQIVRRTLKRDFQFVRTVKEGEQQTHEKVPQKLVNVGGFENVMPALVELCKREIGTGSSTRPFKAMIFFGANSEVQLASDVLQNLKSPGQSMFRQSPLHPARVIEMHGKLSQEARTRAADRFKRAESAIMVTSDVTARGMDFPNVTHVIQVGLPSSQEQYVHRLGRTARGDKTGEGWLLLTNLEGSAFKRSLPDIPLKRDNSLEVAKVDMRKDAQLPEHVAQTLTQVQDATKMTPMHLKAAAYLAALGIFQWMRDKRALLDAMNDRARYGWGMDSLPPIGRRLAFKLGLSRFTDLNIVDDKEIGRGKTGGDGFGRSSSGSSGFRRGDGRQSSLGSRDRGSFGRSSFGDRGQRSERGEYARPSNSDRRGFRQNDSGDEFGGFRSGTRFGRRDGGRESRYSG